MSGLTWFRALGPEGPAWVVVCGCGERALIPAPDFASVGPTTDANAPEPEGSRLSPSKGRSVGSTRPPVGAGDVAPGHSRRWVWRVTGWQADILGALIFTAPFVFAFMLGRWSA